MSQVIVALDTSTIENAIRIVENTKDVVEIYKIGSLLLDEKSHSLLKHIKGAGKKVFADLKFFDIPSTVKREFQKLAEIGIDMATVHTLAGPETLEAVKEVESVLPVGVTLLTSMTPADLLPQTANEQRRDIVLKLIEKAMKCGITHFVLSSYEVEEVKKRFPEIKAMVPGIRLKGQGKNDQKFASTPSFAFSKGADYIIAGRSVYEAGNPREVVLKMMGEGEVSLD